MLRLVDQPPQSSRVSYINTVLVYCYLLGFFSFFGRVSEILHLVFTALHEMQTRSSDENSVCLSVRPSNAWIVTKQKKSQSRFVYLGIDNLV